MAEQLILDFNKKFVKHKSRLSCQVTLKKEHDGIVVHLVQND